MKKIIFITNFLNHFAVNAINCGELFIFTCSRYSYKKRLLLPGIEPQTSYIPSTAYSTPPTVTLLLIISCEFKSDRVNVGKQMRWLFVRNAVNFVVNICKKCGEMRWMFFHRNQNIYCLRIHRNHRISYKNSPHSPHFWQNFTHPGQGLMVIL